jgi:L-fuconolactonase
VRQVLHADQAPRGLCLEPTFLASLRLLGELGMSFDLCMRPAELEDAALVAERCPDTRFILDHCGNADPKAFLPKSRLAPDESPWHDPDQWRRDIDRLAKRPNVACKISGIVARAPAAGWSADDLAPIVRQCLDAFGPDRVVFGGDWPVCTLRASLREWVEALRAIVSDRDEADQRKLFFANAARMYGLTR